MPTTLELCEKYFHTQDIYAILYLPKNANEKDGKCFQLNTLYWKTTFRRSFK